MRYTKTYPSGAVTLDGSQFGINQEVLDIEIRNSKPIKAAVERLKELEDRDEPQKAAFRQVKYKKPAYTNIVVTAHLCLKVFMLKELPNGMISRCKQLQRLSSRVQISIVSERLRICFLLI